MSHRVSYLWPAVLLAAAVSLQAAPVIDPIGPASVPAGKSLIVPVTATSPTGRPLAFTATSSSNRIGVQVHTNEPFWKMSVVQAAPTNTPGAFQIPFRTGVVTVTNLGDLTFMLFRKIAPHTVDVIQGLTASGFYNSNTIFHRVVPGFVIQGGDPETNGMGGPVFRYDDEFSPRAIFSGNGQLALANSGKDTDGSQFFITLGPQRFLDFGYTLFGQLVRGFNVLSAIASTPTNGAGRPLTDVIITRASFVPDPFDTVLTLTATTNVGASSAIRVVADDGAGGRTTNSFTATIVSDSANDQPFLYPDTVTNRVAPVNGRLTNTIRALDLEGDATYWFAYYGDPTSVSNTASSSSFLGQTNGQLQCLVAPRSNYVGSLRFAIYVSSNPNWNIYRQYYPPSQWPPYDAQTYTFTFGDTAISARGTNLIAGVYQPFTNELLATFTNGVPDSAATNFTALINWGDNSTNDGVVVRGLSGRKEVRGSHTYSHSGQYPIYLTIRSTAGASATVVSTAFVPPRLDLTGTGTRDVVRWPAWATDYHLQSSLSLVPAGWQTATNVPTLVGYESVVTNDPTGGSRFFRLER